MDGGANTGYRELLQVVADPSRWRILALLSAGPRTVGELVERLDVAQPSVSHHLARLRESGLVHSVAEGRSRRYGWAEVIGGSVQAEVQESLRRWLAGEGREAVASQRINPVDRPIEVHLL
jgi:DNA-binding transcriptional ArsR family regulator